MDFGFLNSQNAFVVNSSIDSRGIMIVVNHGCVEDHGLLYQKGECSEAQT